MRCTLLLEKIMCGTQAVPVETEELCMCSSVLAGLISTAPERNPTACVIEKCCWIECIVCSMCDSKYILNYFLI